METIFIVAYIIACMGLFLQNTPKLSGYYNYNINCNYSFSVDDQTAVFNFDFTRENEGNFYDIRKVFITAMMELQGGIKIWDNEYIVSGGNFSTPEETIFTAINKNGNSIGICDQYPYGYIEIYFNVLLKYADGTTREKQLRGYWIECPEGAITI
ncbi:MAG: hypothetical protein K9H26_10745 [Prolixibacteraceae bacterium]|nr:hypothetical protein [Prolixibacteraceae bacterium]